jgi:hypothetical protein
MLEALIPTQLGLPSQRQSLDDPRREGYSPVHACPSGLFAQVLPRLQARIRCSTS